MEAKELYEIAIKFSDAVDYRTKIRMPEIWHDWFMNEADKATYDDFHVFCTLIMHFLKQDRDYNIELAYILACESEMIEAGGQK
jgi:hypothetical protein